MSTAEYADWRRAKKNQSQANIIKQNSEVGVLPTVVDPDRRAACEFDLMLYLQTYFPESTGLSPFSEDHENAIQNIQNVLLRGGRYAQAVYRGFSKTTISENACVWATTYGHRNFVPLFGADGTLAANSIDSIRKELESNDLLAEDFPEVCIPIQQLEGKFQRCASQTHNGERTYMRWTGDWIVLPTIEGSKASGNVLMARGILSASRGIKVKTPAGKNLRPDGCVIDDFQTDESAKHPGQVTKRLLLIKKAILKSAGHRKSIGCVVNGTVIEENDGMEQLLEDPGWQSNRVPMVKQWADRHDDLWMEQYQDIRLDFDKEVAGSQEAAHARANEFYLANREEMDAGCIVSWDSCYDEDVEHSAIQHAYNLLIDDGKEVFEAECQQRPLVSVKADDEFLTTKEIQEKMHAQGRGQVPQEVEKLVGFIDIQKEVLIWEQWGVSTAFDGFKVDEGTFPDQRTLYWEKQNLRYKLSETEGYAGMSFEARLYKALMKLTDDLLSRKWVREMDNVEMEIQMLGIDARYQNKTVRKVFRDSKFKSRIQLCMGYGIGAKKTPMSRKKIKEDSGEKKGFGWFLGKADAGIQTLETDVNVLKTFFHRRLATPLGQSGSFSLYHVKDPLENRLSGDHYNSERRTQLKGPYGDVDEWDIKPGDPDNDKLDCAVGCCAIASFTGTEMVGAENEGEVKKPRPAFDWDKVR